MLNDKKEFTINWIKMFFMINIQYHNLSMHNYLTKKEKRRIKVIHFSSIIFCIIFGLSMSFYLLYSIYSNTGVNGLLLSYGMVCFISFLVLLIFEYMFLNKKKSFFEIYDISTIVVIFLVSLFSFKFIITISIMFISLNILRRITILKKEFKKGDRNYKIKISANLQEYQYIDGLLSSEGFSPAVKLGYNKDIGRHIGIFYYKEYYFDNTFNIELKRKDYIKFKKEVDLKMIGKKIINF